MATRATLSFILIQTFQALWHGHRGLGNGGYADGTGNIFSDQQGAPSSNFQAPQYEGFGSQQPIDPALANSIQNVLNFTAPISGSAPVTQGNFLSTDPALALSSQLPSVNQSGLDQAVGNSSSSLRFATSDDAQQAIFGNAPTEFCKSRRWGRCCFCDTAERRSKQRWSVWLASRCVSLSISRSALKPAAHMGLCRTLLRSTTPFRYQVN